MSSTINVYCKDVSAEIIPPLIRRLNEYDMIVSIHPEFQFDADNDSGYLPFKFTLKDPFWSSLENKELRSGFEIYIDDFNLKTEKEKIQPKRSLMDRITGKKHPEKEFAPEKIEEKLSYCNHAVSFVWHGGDTFAFRFASLTSAILTEITNGVRSYENETWYDNERLVDKTFDEVIDYEEEIDEKDLDITEFTEW